jgi:hypothetical protein
VDRKHFIDAALKLGVCSCALSPLAAGALTRAVSAQDDDAIRIREERDFVLNWLSDLLDAMDRELDPAVAAKLMAACGRRCYERHQFKRDIAAQGRGDLDALILAYKKNFEIWREGDLVHIRYGETSKACYCPAAKARPGRPGDLHCECTRATHAAVFEAALGRSCRVDIVKTLRRGGRTCHFVVHV